MARAMQTLVVSKSVAETRASAENVFEDVIGRKPETSRETSGSWRFRLFSPDRCKLRSHRTAVIKPGVTAVYCDRR